MEFWTLFPIYFLVILIVIGGLMLFTGNAMGTRNRYHGVPATPPHVQPAGVTPPAGTTPTVVPASISYWRLAVRIVKWLIIGAIALGLIGFIYWIVQSGSYENWIPSLNFDWWPKGAETAPSTEGPSVFERIGDWMMWFWNVWVIPYGPAIALVLGLLIIARVVRSKFPILTMAIVAVVVLAAVFVYPEKVSEWRRSLNDGTAWKSLTTTKIRTVVVEPWKVINVGSETVYVDIPSGKFLCLGKGDKHVKVVDTDGPPNDLHEVGLQSKDGSTVSLELFLYPFGKGCSY